MRSPLREFNLFAGAAIAMAAGTTYADEPLHLQYSAPPISYQAQNSIQSNLNLSMPTAKRSFGPAAQNLSILSLTGRSEQRESYAVPMAALSMSMQRNDLQGAALLAGGCAMSVAGDYLLGRITGARQNWSPDYTVLQMCGASYMQSRYGSLYGVPAASSAAGIGNWNSPTLTDDAFAPSLTRSLGVAAMTFAISSLITRPINSDRGFLLSLNNDGTLRTPMPRAAAQMPITQNSRPGHPNINLEFSKDSIAGSSVGLRVKWLW
jgi:hypothetical protein